LLYAHIGFILAGRDPVMSALWPWRTFNFNRASRVLMALTRIACSWRWAQSEHGLR
jgi:hypothetical protein